MESGGRSGPPIHASLPPYRLPFATSLLLPFITRLFHVHPLAPRPCRSFSCSFQFLEQRHECDKQLPRNRPPSDEHQVGQARLHLQRPRLVPLLGWRAPHCPGTSAPGRWACGLPVLKPPAAEQQHRIALTVGR